MSEGRPGPERGGSLRLSSRPRPSGATVSQPVVRGSAPELAWRILRVFGPGGGDLGETCTALRALGL